MIIMDPVLDLDLISEAHVFFSCVSLTEKQKVLSFNIL